MNDTSKMPTFDQMMNPVLQALFALGGSGTISEIDDKVIEIMKLPEEIQNIPHNPEKSSKTEVEYRLAWTKTYLKKYGLLENSERSVWAIIGENKQLIKVDPKEVVKKVRENDKKEKKNIIQDETDEEVEDNELWENELQNIIKNIKPDAFERLTQRLLRELGFVQVEVTGKSGDGGIDGKGIAKINSIMSFHVYFQCKRYKEAVSSKEIRDFRGAMAGRADKGIFLTTGYFTRDASLEARREGAPPIDLIDGTQFVQMIKSLKIGVKTEMVEKVIIEKDYFEKN